MKARSSKENTHTGMASRGVTRPMAEKEQRGVQNPEGGRMDMLYMHHKHTLWVYWFLIMLGAWLVVSPMTFDYSGSISVPSGGRTIWISDSMRVWVAKWNDILCGVLLMIFGWRSLTPNRPVSLWVACFIGIWLNFAPVIFWAPSPYIYNNDTFVGVLVITLSILIPGMPNMINYMKMGSQVPPGWTYNPSSWPQRWIMIVLAFFGWIVSRYLGSFQLGYTDHAWDPFFGSSTMKVLNSDMSHSLPVSDGAFGALAYTFEFLMGWMGSPARWRTMPWMVTFFGILVIPLGLVHIFLVISQPLVVGEWCTFCLLAAAIMLPMIPLELDEVVAMGQHMVQAKRRGDNMWEVFWKGGKSFEKNEDGHSPELIKLSDEPGSVVRASLWGMSWPWTLLVATLLGCLGMVAPAAWDVAISTNAAHIFHLLGSLIVVVSVISMGEVVRMGRYLNIPLALVLAIAPWFAGDANSGLQISGTLIGVAVAFLSIPKGPRKERYGLWDRYVK